MNESFITSKGSLRGEDFELTEVLKKPAINLERPSSTYLFLEQALLYVGDNALYSKRVLIFLCIYWIAYSFLLMGMPILLEAEPVFFCPIKGGTSYFPCHESEACENYELNEILIKPINSIEAEFKLVCHRKRMVPWINTAIFASIFAAGPFFSFLSNKIGRRKAIFLSCSLSSISLMIAGLVTNFNIWLFLIFMAGGGFAGLEVVGRVYLSEISGSNFRINSMGFLNFFWSGSQILLVFINAVVFNWRYIFVIFMGILFFVFAVIGHLFVILESPKYLLHKKKIIVC